MTPFDFETFLDADTEQERDTNELNATWEKNRATEGVAAAPKMPSSAPLSVDSVNKPVKGTRRTSTGTKSGRPVSLTSPPS